MQLQVKKKKKTKKKKSLIRNEFFKIQKTRVFKIYFYFNLFKVDVEYSHVRFLGNLALNLWDCGGQQSFMENYFSSQKEHIFRNASVLIYVFDVENEESEKEGIKQKTF